MSNINLFKLVLKVKNKVIFTFSKKAKIVIKFEKIRKISYGL